MGDQGSSTEFGSLFTAIPDALLIADDARYYIDANPAACELLGQSREQIIGTRIEEHTDIALARVVDEQWTLFLREGRQAGEYALRRPDGSVRIVEFQARAGIAPNRHLSILRDVTDRRMADRLLEDRNLLKAVIAHSPIGIAVYRGVDLTCEISNAACEGMFPQQRHVGLHAREIFAEAPAIHEALSSSRGAAHSQRLVAVAVGAATSNEAFQRTTHVNAFLVPLRDPGGRFDRVLALFVDVTTELLQRQQRDQLVAEREEILVQARSDLSERLRAETELRNAQERLWEARKLDALGRVAAGVAHGMNNVLSIVLGCADMGLQSVTGDDPVHAELMEIRLAAERGAAFTQQLLTFCQGRPMPGRPASLGKLLSALSPVLRRSLPDSVRLQLALKEGPLALIDPAGVQQAIVNLVLNARDAMPAGGEVVIGVDELDVDGDGTGPSHVPPGHYIELSVTDTGHGMSEETKCRIFEPFFTTKPAGTASGLGLAVVFGIVKQSNGYVHVESSPGQGARISLLFPALSAAAREPSDRPSGAARGPRPRGATETILLVEDEDAVRAVAARFLRRFGYGVLEASNGEMALDTLASHPEIDLVLSDVCMPGMDGFALAKRIQRELPRMRVILMSGYADLAAHLESIPLECPFIQKPFTPALLDAKIRESLDNEVP